MAHTNNTTDTTQSHWSQAQIDHLQQLQDTNAYIGYYCSSAHGRPANGGKRSVCRPGAVHERPGPLRLSCGKGALHVTQEPHKWCGSRVWICALVGPWRSDGLDKAWGLRREVVGEILPEETCDQRLGARLGRKDLCGASLRGADLRRANLCVASLRGADLRGADLHGASLCNQNQETLKNKSALLK